MPSRPAAAAALAALLGLTACQPSPQPLLEVIHARTDNWLNTQGARQATAPTTRLTDWSRHISWNVEVDRSWTEFAQSLERARPSFFERCAASRRSVTCSNRMSGDTVVLVVSLGVSGRPTRASVSLTGRAE